MKVLGPYSPAVRAGGFVWCSGQIPLDQETGALVAGDVEAQTARAIENLKGVLASEGLSLADVVKTTVFISDMDDFARINAVYAEKFGETRPARSCVQVARLPKDAKIEIEAVAVAK